MSIFAKIDTPSVWHGRRCDSIYFGGPRISFCTTETRIVLAYLFFRKVDTQSHVFCVSIHIYSYLFLTSQRLNFSIRHRSWWEAPLPRSMGCPLPARVRGIWGFSHPVTPRSMWGLGSEWHCYWQCSCIMWRFPVMIRAIVAALLHLSRSVSIRIFLPGMRIYSCLFVSIRICSYLLASTLGAYLFV